jgi:hypothetical protein
MSITSYLKMTGLIIATAALMACQHSQASASKHDTCKAIAHKLHISKGHHPTALSYHNDIDKQRLVRQWHKYQCNELMG